MTPTSPTSTPHWTPEIIAQRVRELGPWFHNLHLQGVQTCPDHFLHDYPTSKFKRFAGVLPQELRGQSVLDIGCCSGFYSLEMKKRGANRVLGIDSDDDCVRQARFAAEVCDLDVEFQKLSVYDVGALGEKFDLVIFMGVLYHLRHPLLALDLIHEHVARDKLLFQSLQRGSDELATIAENYPFSETAHFHAPDYPKLHFIENRYADDETNWWIPNASCSAAMLRSAGFEVLEQPISDVFWCRRRELTAAPDGPRAVYPAISKTA